MSDLTSFSEVRHARAVQVLADLDARGVEITSARVEHAAIARYYGEMNRRQLTEVVDEALNLSGVTVQPQKPPTIREYRDAARQIIREHIIAEPMALSTEILPAVECGLGFIPWAESSQNEVIHRVRRSLGIKLTRMDRAIREKELAA